MAGPILGVWIEGVKIGACEPVECGPGCIAVEAGSHPRPPVRRCMTLSASELFTSPGRS